MQKVSKSFNDIRFYCDLLEQYVRTHIGSPVVAEITVWDDTDFRIEMNHSTINSGMSLEEVVKDPDKCKDIKHTLYYHGSEPMVFRHYRYSSGALVKARGARVRPLSCKKLCIGKLWNPDYENIGKSDEEIIEGLRCPVELEPYDIRREYCTGLNPNCCSYCTKSLQIVTNAVKKKP